MNRRPIFDCVREMLGRRLRQSDVGALDAAIDRAIGSATDHPGTAAGPRRLGPAGIELIKKWEGCHKVRPDGLVEAYPDPGSADGRPWTIGWGSTGRGIAEGTVWTRAQCDERFAADLARYADEVSRAIGDAPTTANQFDALVSFHYNTGAIARATLTRKHRAGDFAGAGAEFARWIHAGGKPMRGLHNRRADEARLYSRRSPPPVARR